MTAPPVGRADGVLVRPTAQVITTTPPTGVAV